MTVVKAQDNGNNNAKEVKPDGAASKPASAGWSRLKSGNPLTVGDTAKAKDKADVKKTDEKKEEKQPKPKPALKKPSSAGWGKLKAAGGISEPAENAKTVKVAAEEKPTPVISSAKDRWGKLRGNKELLPVRNAKPQLTRTNSLVVPGQRGSIVSGDGRDSPHSLSSRRDSTRSFGSGFSAIDLKKLREVQNQQAAEEEEDKNKSVQSSETYIQLAIPYLPMWLASICLIMNILIPGSGTILSGFSIFCCGKSRIRDVKENQDTSIFCTNFFVGCAQLFTVTFMLVGWFWSLTWGIYMIILAVEKMKENKKDHEAKLQALALTAFNPQMRSWTLGKG